MSVRFTVGGVLWLGLRTWFRGALRFLAIAAVLYFPQLVWRALHATDPIGRFERFMSDQHLVVKELVSGRYVLIGLMTAAIAHSTAAALLGRKPPILGPVKAAVRRWLPVAGIAIIVNTLTWLAAAAVFLAAEARYRILAYGTLWGLTVPLRALFCLAIPIAALEGRGLRASIARGLVLTRGSRLRLCAIVALLQVAELGAGELLRITLSSDWAMVVAMRVGAQVVLGSILFVYAVVWTSITAVIGAVAFRVLREAKEGPPADELANVFA